MKIKLGCNPLCWMNTDFPQMKGQVSVVQCLSEIAMIGYEGVEMEDPFLKVIKDLPVWLHERQLQCIGKWHSTQLLENSIESELEKLEKHCDMLEALGAKIVNLAECSRAVHQEKKTSLSDRPQLKTQGDWENLCRGLDRLAIYIDKRGLISAYHHHMGTVVQSAEDIDRLMEGTKHLGLLFDTGHLLFAEADPMTVLEKHISRVTHFHCKSVRPEILKEKIDKKSSFFDAVMAGIFTVPGDDGNFVDYERIIDLLTSHEYEGWLVVEAEQDPEKADPFAYAQVGYETLHSLLYQAHYCLS